MYIDLARADMTELYAQHPELKLVETQGQHRINARRAVLRLAPKSGVGVEIGVLTGLFSEVLVEETEPSKLYLVDPWDQLHGSSFPCWGKYTAGQTLDTKVAVAAAKHRAEFYGPECHVVEKFSKDWLNDFNEPFLDWVYLDAKHTYEYVYETLQLLRPRLKSGGVIMGDDCWVKERHRYSETYLAVVDFLAECNFLPIHMDQHGQWAITHQENIRMGSQDEQ